MCEVNLADEDAFEDNLDLLENHQRNQYEDAFSNYKKMGNNIYRFQERYYDNARFIVYAELPFSYKFARCGMSVHGRPGNCKKRMFCTCCSYKAGTDVYARFQDCFHGRTAYFVTFGYKEGLAWEDRNDCNAYWDAADYALSNVLTKADGAIVSHEMHLKGMHPVVLNPHSHAVLSLSGFAGAFELQQQLQDKVEEHLRNEAGRMESVRTPDVKVKLIEDEEHFERSIRYLFKPIELKAEYENAICIHGPSPEVIRQLNSEMKDFLKWFTVDRLMRKMQRCKGVFAGGKGGIGLSVKELKQQRRKQGAKRQIRACKGVPTIERFLMNSASARTLCSAAASV